MHNNLYSIALIPDNNISSSIANYKLMLFEDYNCKIASRSPAHITIIPPFTDNSGALIISIKHLINKIIANYKKFSVRTTGWQHFSKRTIYLGCELNITLNKIYNDINNAINEVYYINNSREFVPHITIANRDINPDQFNEIWLLVSKQVVPDLITIDKLAILHYNGQNWDIIHNCILK